MEDQNAIFRLKQGDLTGLEILVNHYQAQAVHAAYLILFERSLAEDIVQSAFIKVAERIHQFDDRRAFAPWFLRIVVNDALKLSRKQKNSVSLEEQLDEPTVNLARSLINPDLQPEEQVEQEETRGIILQAIQSLPPDQRAVIVMRYYLDMSMNDMTVKTGRPLSTIKWWLRDARRRLRSLMSTPQGEQE